MKQVAVRMHPRTHLLLKKAAKLERISFGELIRRAAQYYIERRPQ